jgi:hypothetical protein
MVVDQARETRFDKLARIVLQVVLLQERQPLRHYDARNAIARGLEEVTAQRDIVDRFELYSCAPKVTARHGTSAFTGDQIFARERRWHLFSMTTVLLH